MKKFSAKGKLSKDYFIFAIIVLVLILIASIWRSWSTYNSLIRERQHNYPKFTETIADQIYGHAIYAENFMTYIGKQIAKEHNLKHTDNIVNLIKNPNRQTAKYNPNDVFSNSLIVLLSKHGKKIADSHNGLYKTSESIPSDREEWFNKMKSSPWEVKFSMPQICYITNRTVIPLGIGITDNKNNFKGALIMSIDIVKFLRIVERTLFDYHTSFAILNKNGKIVLSSEENGYTSPLVIKETIENIKTLEKDSGFLEEPLNIGNIEFSFFRNTYPYPFIILVGDGKKYFNKEFRSTLYPRIEQTIIIGIIFIILLYLFQRKIIKPVTNLSEAAIKISKGKRNVTIPKVDNVYEFMILAEQLKSIKHYIEAVNNSRRSLNKALNVKSNFLANMSHELRTPLNAIIGFSDAIKEQIHGKVKKEYISYAKDINTQGIHLLSLIEEILDASKLEAGKMSLRKESFKINELINECIRAIESRAKEKNIKLSFTHPKNIPSINLDKIKIRQAILNLLSNAIKFTEENGSVEISIKYDKANKTISIIVDDDGIGMEKDDLAKIFERFTQIENEYSNSSKGTGLGMSITKDIIELHGGTISVKSNPGDGSTFIIELPV